MKRLIIALLGVLFIGLGLFIIYRGGINSENTASYSNVKKALNQYFVPTHLKKLPRVNNPSADAILLLLSEKYTNSLFVRAWENIALEEGLHLDILYDNDFLNVPSNSYRGIILADSIHKDISPELTKKLSNYIAAGGNLMLVYDAATLNTNNDTAKRFPLMVELLGISCNDNVLKGCRSEISPIGNKSNSLAILGVPPGKCSVADRPINGSGADDAFCAISSAEYGVLNYIHFVIHVEDTSSSLLTTADKQLIAKEQEFGKGKILFINLPITYLWSQTDAMFMHVFLRYFATNMLQLPTLAAVPNGIGGLIMNLHVESIDALVGFSKLQEIGFFQQKPYSIDFTAGPGLDHLNDHLGLNVENNTTTQNWMRYLANLGNAIGSDGGWMHNYFCAYANENNQKEFKNYISMNNAAIEKVLGKKVLEYVPSCGNTPSWTVPFLEQLGILGYYTVANTGTAPTQSILGGNYYDKKQLWSFPVLPFEKGASIRDFGRIGYPKELITQWYKNSTQFVSAFHTSRLIYFHPPDILLYPQYIDSLKTWLNLTKELQAQGVFQWYSMVDLAQFLNEREKVYWRVEYKKNIQYIQAAHPKSLISQSWILSKNKCEKPEIISGEAKIREDNKFWIVTAGNSKNLKFKCVLKNN